MFKKVIYLFLVLSISPVFADSPQQSFFDAMSQLCGKTFFGKTIFPDDKEHDFYGKKLIMTVKECSEKVIKIPFQVGDDTSRTWILSKTDNGLLFKHDHRLADGSPDPITLYGGLANQSGTSAVQFFAADKETQMLIPAAKTNVWSLKFDNKNDQFIYNLERHNKPRYRAVFDLTE